MTNKPFETGPLRRSSGAAIVLMKYIPAILLFSGFLAPSLSRAAVEETTLLFKDKGKDLTYSEKHQIFQLLDFKVAPDKMRLVDSACEKEADFAIDITDLNSDKIHEVVILGGNTCSSGATGSSIWLFIKDSKGIYHANLGFPAASYEIMEHSLNGYPDLLIGGMGFCSAKWRWNGHKYRHFQNIPTAKGGCDGR